MVGGILTRVEEAHAVFLRCADSGSVPTLMRIRLDGALRDYSNAVKGLEDVLKQSGHIREAPDLAKLKDDRADYKDLVTETPYPREIPQARIPEESKLPREDLVEPSELSTTTLRVRLVPSQPPTPCFVTNTQESVVIRGSREPQRNTFLASPSLDIQEPFRRPSNGLCTPLEDRPHLPKSLTKQLKAV